MTLQTEQQMIIYNVYNQIIIIIIIIAILPNISRSKGSQTMRNIFLENSCTTRDSEASPRTFYKKV